MQEKTKCLCQSDSYEIIYPKTKSGRIVKCKNCGLIYANPRITDFLIKDQILTSEKKIGQEYISDEKNKIKNFKNRLKKIKKFNPSKGQLLDVGSYTGLTIIAAKELNWQATGVEPNKTAADYGIKKYNLKIKNTLLEKACFPSNNFDVITLFQTIEHLPNPNQTLQEIYRILKPNGLIAIETPNINSRAAKTSGTNWRQFIPSHYWFFTKKSLTRLLNKHNFQPIYFQLPSKKISLALIASTIRRIYSNSLGKFLQKLFKKLHIQNWSFKINFHDILFIIAKKCKNNTSWKKN